MYEKYLNVIDERAEEICAVSDALWDNPEVSYAEYEAVKLLTHVPDTDYFEYIRAIRSNPIARKVKLADLAHNSDATRFAGVPVPEDTIGRLRDKYTKAKAILLAE